MADPKNKVLHKSASAPLTSEKSTVRPVRVILKGNSEPLLRTHLKTDVLEPMPRENVPGRGVQMQYNQFDETAGSLSQAHAAIIWVDATNLDGFKGGLNDFFTKQQHLNANTPVTVAATNIEKVVESIQERSAVLGALHAGIRNDQFESVEQNAECLKLHKIFKSLYFDQVQVIQDAARKYEAGSLTRDQFISSIAEKISDFTVQNFSLKNDNKIVEPAEVERLIKVISTFPNEEVKEYAEMKAVEHVGELSKLLDVATARLSEKGNNITFVLHSEADPKTAVCLATQAQKVMSSHKFENGGAGDPFQATIDAVAPPTESPAPAVESSPAPKKNLHSWIKTAMSRKEEAVAQEEKTPPAPSMKA